MVSKNFFSYKSIEKYDLTRLYKSGRGAHTRTDMAQASLDSLLKLQLFGQLWYCAGKALARPFVEARACLVGFEVKTLILEDVFVNGLVFAYKDV